MTSSINIVIFFSYSKDRNSKVVLVTRINSVVAPTVLQFNKDHMDTVATVNKPNTNVVQTELQLLKERTLPDAHVQQADMDVVRMALPTHKDHNMMDVIAFRLHHKRRAALPKMVAPAAITPSNTSLIWNMEAAHVSGTVDARAMPTDSNRLMSVKTHANKQLAKMLANCRRFAVHAPDFIRNTTMTPTETLVQNSFMVVVWAIQITSKRWMNVEHNVS